MPMPAPEGLNADLLDVRDDAMLTPRRAGGLLTQRDHAGSGSTVGWLGLAGCVCFAVAMVYLLATVHSHAGKLNALQATVDAKYVLKTESAAQVNTSTQGERGHPLRRTTARRLPVSMVPPLTAGGGWAAAAAARAGRLRAEERERRRHRQGGGRRQRGAQGGDGGPRRAQGCDGRTLRGVPDLRDRILPRGARGVRAHHGDEQHPRGVRAQVPYGRAIRVVGGWRGP